MREKRSTNSKILNRSSSPIANSKGQMIIEAVLLITIFAVITISISNEFKNREFFQNIAKKPWEIMAGMIQAGEWLPVEEAVRAHPNHHGRHASPEGDDPQ